MADEQTNVTDQNTETEFDPIQEIQNLKNNSVSKEDYDKVVAENKRYLKALIDGQQVATSTAEPVDVDALRKDLFNGEELDNLTYCKKALELRTAILERDGVDIFVGSGSKLNPTDEDYITAQKVADVMQTCIDEADGNSDVFTARLMSMTNDIKIPKKIKK